MGDTFERLDELDEAVALKMVGVQGARPSFSSVVCLDLFLSTQLLDTHWATAPPGVVSSAWAHRWGCECFRDGE